LASERPAAINWKAYEFLGNNHEGSIPFTRSIDYQGLAQLCRKSAGKLPISQTNSRPIPASIPGFEDAQFGGLISALRHREVEPTQRRGKISGACSCSRRDFLLHPIEEKMSVVHLQARSRIGNS
jgi:hypothetical protein